MISLPAPEIWLALGEIEEQPTVLVATLDLAEAFEIVEREVVKMVAGARIYWDGFKIYRADLAAEGATYYRRDVERRWIKNEPDVRVQPWLKVSPARESALADVPSEIRQLADTRRERLMIAAERLMDLAKAEVSS